MKTTPTEELNYELFSSLVNTRFLAHFGSQLVELVLEEAIPFKGPDGAIHSESFSVHFRGPGDAFLPQQTHIFEQEKLGRFELFIVPIGKDPRGFLYQAVFNRMKRSP